MFFGFGFYKDIGVSLLLSSTGTGSCLAILSVLHHRFFASQWWVLMFFWVVFLLLTALRVHLQIGLFSIAFFSIFVVFQTPIRRALKR